MRQASLGAKMAVGNCKPLLKGEVVGMTPDQGGEGGSTSHRRRRRIRPGRTILFWIGAYAVVLAALALMGYEDAVPAVWAPVGALAGYGLGHLASRSPGRLGETMAHLFFFAALAALMIMAVFIVVSRPAETSDPWILAILGAVLGVIAATYVRLKHPAQR
jgi:drug/metabolite transporter (DMT)-like permease